MAQLAARSAAGGLQGNLPSMQLAQVSSGAAGRCSDLPVCATTPLICQDVGLLVSVFTLLLCVQKLAAAALLTPAPAW